MCQQWQRLQQVLCVECAKQTMRATLEIALLVLAGYLTLTDGVSKLLHVIDCNLTHNCNDPVGCVFE